MHVIVVEARDHGLTRFGQKLAIRQAPLI